MWKKKERLIPLIFCSLLALIVMRCGSKGESKKGDGEFIVSIETLPQMTVVSFKRQLTGTTVPVVLNELNDWLNRNGVAPAGVPFAIYYYETTEEVGSESLDWAVCVPVPASVRVDEKSEVKLTSFPPMTVATVLHQGSFDTGESADRLAEWVEDNGFMISGPALEFYLNSGPPPESIRVKVGFVVQPLPDSVEETDETQAEFEEGG